MFPISEHKAMMGLYVAGGVIAAMLLEPLLSRKQGVSIGAQLGMLAYVLVLIGWNVRMYAIAKKETKAEFPKGALEAYTKPVAATVIFVVGFAIFVIPMLTK